jgi:hypothetical protein
MDTHLLSLNVDKAKSRIKKLQSQITELHTFIAYTEKYSPDSFEEVVVHQYAIYGSIATVLENINKEVFEGKKYTYYDVGKIINKTGKPMDELHEIVRKIYRTNKKNSKEKKRI